MANGQMFDPKAMTAAMVKVPLGTRVVVTSLKNPLRSIHVTVTNRGPYINGRVIDLTPAAFEALFGTTRIGVGPVVVVPEDNQQGP